MLFGFGLLSLFQVSSLADVPEPLSSQPVWLHLFFPFSEVIGHLSPGSILSHTAHIPTPSIANARARTVIAFRIFSHSDIVLIHLYWI